MVLRAGAAHDHRMGGRGADVLVGAVLVVAVTVTGVVMCATSRTADGDPFDSTLYWWSWLLFPGAAVLASLLRAGGWRVVGWTLAATAPMGAIVAYLGTIGHDPGDGASMWVAGELFVIAQMAVTFSCVAPVQRWVLERRSG